MAVILHPLISAVLWVLPTGVYGPGLLIALLVGLLSLEVGIMIHSYRLARYAEPTTHRLFRRPFTYVVVPVYFILLGGLGVLVTDPLSHHFLSAGNILSNRMAPTLLQGDHIFYTRGFDSIQRGDLIVYESPKNPAVLWVARVVGGPGDRMDCFSEEQSGVSVFRMRINGNNVPIEPVSLESNQGDLDVAQDFVRGTPVFFRETMDPGVSYVIAETADTAGGNPPGLTLAEDEYFLLGDNRDDSNDSRFTGTTRRRQIVGKYMFTYLSLQGMRCAEHPSEAVRLECESGLTGWLRALRIRWARTGTVAR